MKRQRDNITASNKRPQYSQNASIHHPHVILPVNQNSRRDPIQFETNITEYDDDSFNDLIYQQATVNVNTISAKLITNDLDDDWDEDVFNDLGMVESEYIASQNIQLDEIIRNQKPIDIYRYVKNKLK